MTKSKAAVVIGLNYDTETKLKGLSKLEAAVDCAEDVAAWLEPEFDVELITDATGEVTVNDIKTALKKFQGGPGQNTFLRYKMLLVYFAGHGVEPSVDDLWVLNNASYDAEEAVNVRAACDRAGRSGFPVVVMVSDACRQGDNVPRALRELDGSHLFLNKDPDQERETQVDEMRAARVGKSAWEFRPEGERGFSIFSRAFIRATTEPDAANVTTLEVNGRQVRCVTNETLKKTLQADVDKLLRELNSTRRQKIFISPPSDDDTYIRALPEAMAGGASANPESDEAFGESAAPGDDDVFSADDVPVASTPPIPDFALEPDFSSFETMLGKNFKVSEPPPVSDLDGIGPKTANAFEQLGVYTVADLVNVDSALMAQLEDILPGSAARARTNKWQYRARDMMERSGLRLPVSQIAAASLNLGTGEDLPETAGLQASDVQRDMGNLVPDVERSSFESGCGLLWSGGVATHAEVLPLGSAGYEIVGDTYGGIGSTVRLWDVKGAASCMVAFEDGRSTIMPVIEGYISYGTLDSVGIQSFGMFPIGVPLGDVAARRFDDPELRELLDLRGLLTMTLRDRRSGIVSHAGMAELQDRIAARWHLDPTLAILAAAILMEAGQGRDIPKRLADAPYASELFDIALLSGGDHKEKFPAGAKTACPALTANWTYVSSRDAALPRSLKPMRHHLLGSLWTCFDKVPNFKKTDIYPIGSGL